MFQIQRFRVWVPPGDPPGVGDASHKRPSCVCKPDRTPFIALLSSSRGSTMSSSATTSPFVSSPQEEGPRGVALQRPHCFALHRQSPSLVTLERGKTPSVKQLLPPRPHRTPHKRHWGKGFCQANAPWPKHIKSFLLKFPFYLPLKRFGLCFLFCFVFQDLITTKRNTSPHAHQTATERPKVTGRFASTPRRSSSYPAASK